MCLQYSMSNVQFSMENQSVTLEYGTFFSSLPTTRSRLSRARYRCSLGVCLMDKGWHCRLLDSARVAVRLWTLESVHMAPHMTLRWRSLKHGKNLPTVVHLKVFKNCFCPTQQCCVIPAQLSGAARAPAQLGVLFELGSKMPINVLTFDCKLLFFMPFPAFLPFIRWCHASIEWSKMWKRKVCFEKSPDCATTFYNPASVYA